MNFHKETLEWMQQIKNLCVEAKEKAKNSEQFLNRVQLKIKNENERIIALQKELSTVCSQISEKQNNKETTTPLKEKEYNLLKQIEQKKYPGEVKVTDKEMFLKIYYS